MTDIATSPLLTSSYHLSNSSIRSASPGKSKPGEMSDIVRYTSLFSAVISCLCAGSIHTFSLYGHLFQTRLNYSQTQVNAVALSAQISLCISILFVGYLCDRVRPGLVSFLATIFFGTGYILAAYTYRKSTNHTEVPSKPNDSSVWVMVVAFAMIGMSTTLMYLSAITTCAKNFRNKRNRGLALASPIAAIGLSSFWQSQVASKYFLEYSQDGMKTDIDVFSFFMFLAFLLMASGLVGSFLLKIVDDETLIEEAVQRLEGSRLLENSEFCVGNPVDYGTVINSTENQDIHQQRPIITKQDEKVKKIRYLDLKIAMFLKDPTMWWFALGFLLMSGPGEAYITNLGTIIGTLYPSNIDPSNLPASTATHISIISIMSTAARLIFGSLTDFFAPVPASNFNSHSRSTNLANNSHIFSPNISISRVIFLIGSALLLSAGEIYLAAGFAQDHADRLWVVSVLIGFGYGAVYTLSPLIVSIVWGVENFGTYWGMIAMTPILGVTFWDLIYSSVYEFNSRTSNMSIQDIKKDVLCHGKACYSTTFWAMSVSVWIGCVFCAWAWKGKGGWSRRAVAVLAYITWVEIYCKQKLERLFHFSRRKQRRYH